MPQGKDRNGCSVTLPGHRTGATLAASRRSHIFFAQANTTGKSKESTIGGHDEQGNGAIAL